MKTMKVLIENENGKIIKEDDHIFVIDKFGKRKLKSVFDFDNMKNIFPALFGNAKNN